MKIKGTIRGVSTTVTTVEKKQVLMGRVVCNFKLDDQTEKDILTKLGMLQKGDLVITFEKAQIDLPI